MNREKRIYCDITVEEQVRKKNCTYQNDHSTVVGFKRYNIYIAHLRWCSNEILNENRDPRGQKREGNRGLGRSARKTMMSRGPLKDVTSCMGLLEEWAPKTDPTRFRQEPQAQ